MKRTINTSGLAKSAFLHRSLLVACLLFGLASRAQQPLTVISNVSGAPADMKQKELRSVMMGETQRWKNGKRIVIALMKTTTQLGKTTSAKVYDMSADELNKYWLALVFQGKAQAPVFFTSVSDLENFVAQNPGAIGIVDKQTAVPDVRAVTVDGKDSI